MTTTTAQEGWEAAIAERARAHWTAERTAALAGGKALLLPPADAAPLLRAIGLLRADASMPPPQVRKYFQINHMVTLMGPALRELRARHPTIRLLDAGCGRSYLSLLLAWCGKHVWRHPIEVHGVDRNPELIAECRRRAQIAGLGEVARFEAAWVDEVSSAGVHGVIALHACDTASCDAIELGVRLGAELIALAPCCQAELARGWTQLAAAGGAGAFAPLWRAPHLRREIAAHLTDAMRTLLLAAAGYQVDAIEFVPGEHTRKNTLIRASRRGSPDPAAAADYRALCAATGGAGLGLATRLALP